MRHLLIITAATAALALAACSELDGNLAAEESALPETEQDIEVTLTLGCQNEVQTRATRQLENTDNVQHVTNVRVYAFRAANPASNNFLYCPIKDRNGKEHKYIYVPEFRASKLNNNRTGTGWDPICDDNGVPIYGPDGSHIGYTSVSNAPYEEHTITLKMRGSQEWYYKFLAIGRDDIEEDVLLNDGRIVKESQVTPTDNMVQYVEYPDRQVKVTTRDAQGVETTRVMREHEVPADAIGVEYADTWWPRTCQDTKDDNGNILTQQQYEILDVGDNTDGGAHKVGLRYGQTILHDVAAYLRKKDDTTPDDDPNTDKQYQMHGSEIFAGYNDNAIRVQPNNFYYNQVIEMKRIVVGIMLYVKNVPCEMPYDESKDGHDHGDADHLVYNGVEVPPGAFVPVDAVGIAPHNKYYHAVRVINEYTAQQGKAALGRCYVLCKVPAGAAKGGDAATHAQYYIETNPDPSLSATDDRRNALPLQGAFITPQPQPENVENERGRTSLELVYYHLCADGTYREICRREIKMKYDTTHPEDPDALHNDYKLDGNHIYCVGMKGKHGDGTPINEPISLQPGGYEDLPDIYIYSYGRWQADVPVEM